MAITVRLMTLQGRFELQLEVECENFEAVRATVESHAQSGGYRNVKRVDDGDGTLRFTATTPGGRGGRNIAYVDLF